MQIGVTPAVVPLPLLETCLLELWGARDAGRLTLAAYRASGDIEKVDLLVGCLCEPLPQGFGFSDTAFRVFVLMASRRLNADRFLSADFKPEIYTPQGYQAPRGNASSPEDFEKGTVKVPPDDVIPIPGIAEDPKA